ncbi:MAG: hypothetical protein KTR25_12290 [Myxococcales bacterium]|nr:hypothetical protein [Myxococcales bacterium]
MILDESLFAATVIISSGTEVFHLHIAVEDLSSYNSAEETLSGLLDALDCLVGQLETNGRAHRELPIGSGVIYGDKSYTVDIQKSITKLERLADTWLKPR